MAAANVANHQLHAIHPAQRPQPWGNPKIFLGTRGRMPRRLRGSYRPKPTMRHTLRTRRHMNNGNNRHNDIKPNHEFFLHRTENPQWAYELINRKTPISLGPRGDVVYGKRYRRVANATNTTLVFEEPDDPEDDEEQVVLIKILILQHLRRRHPIVADHPEAEIFVMQEFGYNTPNNDRHIMKCTEALKDDTCLYIVMPYAMNGDLYSRFQTTLRDTLQPQQHDDRHGQHHQQEQQEQQRVIPRVPATMPVIHQHARIWLHKILQNVSYLQQENHNIAHRDLKGVNIVVQANDDTTLIDFATSVRVPHVHNNDEQGTLVRYRIQPDGVCGTPAYMAPEMNRLMTLVRNHTHNHEHHHHDGEDISYDGFALDVWALGIILFQLLTGKYPFSTSSSTNNCYQHFIEQNGLVDDESNQIWLTNAQQIFASNEAEYRWVETDLLPKIESVQLLDRDVRELLRGMLDPDIQRRFTIADVQGHPWMLNRRVEEERK